MHWQKQKQNTVTIIFEYFLPNFLAIWTGLFVLKTSCFNKPRIGDETRINLLTDKLDQQQTEKRRETTPEPSQKPAYSTILDTS